MQKFALLTRCLFAMACILTLSMASAGTLQAPTVSVSVTPSQISAGGHTLLSWSTTNATTCTSSGSWGGPRALSGADTTPALTSSQVYMLTCTGPGGSTKSKAYVTVFPPPTVTISTSPSTVVSGGQTLLSWSSTNATACISSGSWGGPRALSGAVTTPALTSNKVYTLTCTNPGGGSAKSTATVTVFSPPTVTVTTSPSNIISGGHTLLSWSSTNATACISSGSWGGPRALAGADTTPALTSNKVYTLTCTNPAGSATSTAIVKVFAVPTVTISTNPSNIAVGGHTLLSWSSTNATACVSSGSWGGPRALAGADTTPALTSEKVYTLTCTNPAGSATSTAIVKVVTPPTVTIATNPSKIASGSHTLLSWSSTNATACVSSGSWGGPRALAGADTTPALTSDKVYAITCTGPGGTASQSASVTVVAATGTATLSWTPPKTNTNGTPVVPLSGYHIYYQNGAAGTLQSVAVSGGQTTSFEISGLAKGTWYFDVAADAEDGTEGPPSTIGSITF